MKKTILAVLSTLLVLAVLCGACAMEAGDYLGTRKVANCREYVTLRTWANTGADSVCRVPLGARVDAYYYNSTFTECWYDGMHGYILSRYLTEEYNNGWNYGSSKNPPKNQGYNSSSKNQWNNNTSKNPPKNQGGSHGGKKYKTQTALAKVKLPLRSGPSNGYSELGTYKVANQYVTVHARHWDSRNSTYWLKVSFTYHENTITGWTTQKRFDSSTYDINALRDE